MATVNAEDIGLRLRQAVAATLDLSIEKVQDTSSFVADFGADSLDSLEVVMAVEDCFEIEISDEDAETLTTVGEAIRYVCDQVALKPEAPSA